MLYGIRCNPMHPLYRALPRPYVPVWVNYTRCYGRTSVHLCASSLQNLAVPQDFYYPVRISVERSCVIPNVVVWDWRVSRAGPLPFNWHGCSLSFCLLLFSFSLLLFYGLVLWACGLRTDRISIANSHPRITNLFLIIIIIIKCLYMN